MSNEIPPRYAKIILLNKFIFCIIATVINPPKEAIKVDIRIGINISAGFSLQIEIDNS